MSNGGRAAPMTLATLVGALAGLAFSPVPTYFDAEWLAWLLVPLFAVAGGVIAFFFLRASADDRP